ncbi:MAG: S-adenosylmethionine:tRNA ribosyltransferase-isomerase [Vicingaceae bacterium]
MEREDLASKDFSYELPDSRIAKFPLANRNQSKLLTYKAGKIGEDHFFNLEKHLPKDSVLVFNNTKVLAARLQFKKLTGARIEVFCLEPFQTTVEQALSATESCLWECMVGNLKRFKDKDVIELEIAGTTLKANIYERKEQAVIIRFEWEGGQAFSSILEEAGEVPLPPYLNRKAEQQDRKTYQTVYAKEEGAVAAPTAGLHFVPEQLVELKDQGHQLAYLTLYVGAGTFRPLKSEKLTEHQMHQERIVISKQTIKQLADKKGKIISIGTTSLRSLESLYWLAVKRKNSGNDSENFVNQEDAYQLPTELSWHKACELLVEQLEVIGEEVLDFHSALFIMPGYQWQAIDGLITNFHQPQSTLLALVAAWIGEDWRKVYDHALENNFRFLSYGDSSLLL